MIFYHTSLGRLLRATSDDAEIVPLMGGSNAHAFALATMLASGVVAVAGVLMAMKTNFDPTIGPSRLLFAFEAVIIGGLGNLWGTLLGGLVLGVAQAVGGQIDPGLQVLSGHLIFLLILVFRPQGLMQPFRLHSRRSGQDALIYAYSWKFLVSSRWRKCGTFSRAIRV
jgi:branched-chain amino acid transport system permease protein